jgi:tRNA A-37 threonylcarbamoyl transferase component Bud32
VVVHDADGKKLIWSIVEDISERKRIDRMKNEFVSTVSHELRTPLTAIRGALALTGSGALGKLPEAAGDMVAVAERNSQRLLSLINDLLDMEKLLIGKMPFNLQWQALKPALFRGNSDQVRHRSWERLAVYRRSQASTAMDAFIRDPDSFFYQGEMLKDGDSTTVMVITLDGTPYVVKRYNLRNFWYGIRRLFRPTRAWRCWVNAHMLQTLGVATPAPVLMLERRWGPLRRQAYYMTELVAGSNVLQFVGNEPINGARWQQTLGRFRDLLQTMRRYRFVHGDMKATNIMATPDALVVLDLDAMREIRSKRVFNRYFKRDLNRWLANWRHRPDIVSVLRDTVTEIEADND